MTDKQQMNGEYAWAIWLAGTLGTFAVLEAVAFQRNSAHFPTLSATLQRWMGIDPPARWGQAAPVIFLAGWAWLTLHVVRYQPRTKIVLISEGDAVAAAEAITEEAAKWWRKSGKTTG